MQHHPRMKIKGKKAIELPGNAIIYLIIIMVLVLIVAAIYYYITSKAPDASALRFSR